jgi:putative ABC transport system substrate-binding protein
LALVAAPTLAEKPPRIGVTLAGSPPDRFAEAFQRGMAEHGWIEGKNLAVEYRYAAGRAERYQSFMQEFAQSRVDVIVAGGGPLAQQAAVRATGTIPIIAPVMADPVAAGLVTNLARPGGQLTGLSLMIADTSGKRVELLREAFPRMRRFAALLDPANDFGQSQATDEAAKVFGFELRLVIARRPQELAQAFDQATQAGAQGMVGLSSAMLNANRKRLIELAERSRLPAMYPNREYVEAGGLISYGVDISDMYRSSAKYVDRILRGAKPGEMPVEQPTKFELLVNARTARTLGVVCRARS